MSQPTLFDSNSKRNAADDEVLVLYALGDFQSRRLVLAGRDLPLDRLRGALRRAAETFGIEPLTDERAVEVFAALGAQVQRRHPFAAKHPYHVIVPKELADRAQSVYEESKSKRAEGKDEGKERS